MDTAHEKVDNILKSQKGPGIQSDIEMELNNYFKIVASRSLDDYRRLEGMEDSESSIEISGVKLE